MTVKVIVMTENTCHTRCMRMDAFLNERFHCALKIHEFFIDKGILVISRMSTESVPSLNQLLGCNVFLLHCLFTMAQH